MSDETPDALCGDGADARYCPVFWSKNAECDDLRALAAEILGELDDIAGPWSTRAARVKLAKWRERAGLEPATATAETRQEAGTS